MSPISISAKQAITRYSAQARYKDRQKKIAAPHTEQAQKDLVSISSRAQELSKLHTAEKNTETVTSVPEVYTNGGLQ